MPDKLHKALKKSAKKKGLKGKRQDAYVYGTMQKQANKPKPHRRGAGRGR